MRFVSGEIFRSKNIADVLGRLKNPSVISVVSPSEINSVVTPKKETVTLPDSVVAGALARTPFFSAVDPRINEHADSVTTDTTIKIPQTVLFIM